MRHESLSFLFLKKGVSISRHPQSNPPTTHILLSHICPPPSPLYCGVVIPYVVFEAEAMSRHSSILLMALRAFFPPQLSMLFAVRDFPRIFSSFLIRSTSFCSVRSSFWTTTPPRLAPFIHRHWPRGPLPPIQKASGYCFLPPVTPW